MKTQTKNQTVSVLGTFLALLLSLIIHTQASKMPERVSSITATKTDNEDTMSTTLSVNCIFEPVSIVSVSWVGLLMEESLSKIAISIRSCVSSVAPPSNPSTASTSSNLNREKGITNNEWMHLIYWRGLCESKDYVQQFPVEIDTACKAFWVLQLIILHLLYFSMSHSLHVQQRVAESFHLFLYHLDYYLLLKDHTHINYHGYYSHWWIWDRNSGGIICDGN